MPHQSKIPRRLTLLLAVCLALNACAAAPSDKSVSAGMGPNPQLPAPESSLLPTVNVAKATGWPAGTTPQPAAGLKVSAFATGLDHPRWIHVLPNGDVLVAESNAPPKADEGFSFKAWITGLVMKRAGAAVPSANRITLLRDADGDGVAELRVPFATAAEGLMSPFGMALVGEDFFVANADGILRFAYSPGQTRLQGPGTLLGALPGGPVNHHWTKSLIASPDGRKLYAGVGSNSNVAERGMDAEIDRAAILEFDIKTGSRRVYASGLRNPVGMAWEPVTGLLWTVVNERDELGNDLVPDYLSAVYQGAFYGWPYSYFGANVDVRVQPQRPELVSKARVPDYALGAHTASLGLAWSGGNKGLPARFAQGMFIGQHGSWNRKPHSGYQVIFVPFSGGRPQGMPLPVLEGFLDAEGQAMGRPVGVALDGRGGLLVADDVGNVIWRVSAVNTVAP